MEFKKGDRVKCIERLPSEDELIIGKIYRVTGVDDLNDWIEFGHDNDPYMSKSFIKIGGSMSKYDELKERIERITGWDKEADDILGKMDTAHVIEFNQDATSGHGHIKVWKRGYKEERKSGEGYFCFFSQCEKLDTFKEALMFLLDHSDIKKTLVGSEVKADIEGKVYKVKVLSEDC